MKKSARNVCRFKIKLYLCNRNRERYNGRLAQLVQSICLTSRGSAVRIRQRPLRYEIDSRKPFWAFSSAGSEHLPYKQRVGGSNPSTPTKKNLLIEFPFRAFSSAGSEHLPYKQRVGGSNPSTPTSNKPRICEAFLFFYLFGSEHFLCWRCFLERNILPDILL